jgi:hypothetical protein
MKKIIYLGLNPFIKKYEKKLYINYFLEKGSFEIIYLDLSKIFFKNLEVEDTIEKDYVTKIGSFCDLEKILQQENIQNILFITLCPFNFKFLKLFKVLKKYNAVISFIHVPGFNAWVYKRLGIGVKKFLLSFYKVRTFVNIFKVFLEKIYKVLVLKREYDVVFFSGSNAKKFYPKTNVIAINHPDYDTFQESQNIKRFTEKKYCVFLDEYLPFHPDLQVINLKKIEPIKYYSSLLSFFDFLEQKLNLKVVIAAHPKANYNNEQFEGREIYKYKTSELVKDAEFVISHFSTSISFAVLNYKPIIFCYTNEYKLAYRTNFFDFMLWHANYLGMNTYNINNLDKTKFSISRVDKEKYSRYKYDYLTSKETENLYSGKIVYSYLMSLWSKNR